MKKIIQAITTAVKGFFAILDALDFLALLAIILMFVVAIPATLLMNYTTIEQPVLVSAISVVVAIIAVTFIFLKRKKG